MHASELVDLAALIALGAPALLESHPRLDENALHTYWSASRCRLDRWGRALRVVNDSTDDSQGGASQRGELWEEIVVSEIPARIVAAFLVAHDQRHHRDEAGPIGRNVLCGHLDARRRAVEQIDRALGRHEPSAGQCSELTARTARWSDVLLAYMLPLGNVDEFAVDVGRAREFAFDASEHRTGGDARLATAFLRTSLRLALEPVHSVVGYSADLNSQIACGLAGCFHSAQFASFGHLDAAWMHRIQRVADDTILMVENLISAH
jgi:hypothetical protein